MAGRMAIRHLLLLGNQHRLSQPHLHFCKMSFSAGLVNVVSVANNFDTGSSKGTSVPFYVGNQQVGLVRQDILAVLRNYPKDFIITADAVTLASHLRTFEERSERLATILAEWRAKDVFATLRGWRDECYNIDRRWGEPPLLKLERSATCLFGFTRYGVHIISFLNHSKKGLCMWIARRSKTKPTYPGKLDHMVAGGLASGQSVIECVQKECGEEASVPEHIVSRVKPAGAVSYFHEDEKGLYPECSFVYDLEVPEDFTPENADGEVESFQLQPIEEVKKLIITGDFKFNCALTALDFLIRHGVILPDEEPNYTFLTQKLHRSL